MPCGGGGEDKIIAGEDRISAERKQLAHTDPAIALRKGLECRW